MVACKTVGEYKRNQEKNKEFCLEEAKQQKAGKAVQPIGEAKFHRPSTRNTRPRTQLTNWSPAKVRRVATQNQLKQQQKTKKPVNSQEPKVVKAERIKETTANPQVKSGRDLRTTFKDNDTTEERGT